MFKLETKRLLLRPLGPGDFDAVHSYARDPEVVRYMTFGPNTEDDTKKYLKECSICWQLDILRKYDCAIILRETEKLAGAVGIYLDEDLRQGMMGWVLHPDYHGLGYMTEAAGGLMDYGFRELGLHRVYATCYAPNRASYNVMEKLGMRREAVLKSARRLRNTEPEAWCDELIYAILDDEWKATHNA